MEDDSHSHVSFNFLIFFCCKAKRAGANNAWLEYTWLKALSFQSHLFFDGQ